MCNCQSIPNTVLTCCIVLSQKCEPLSEEIVASTPKRGIISFNIPFVTSLALFDKEKLLANLKMYQS